MKRPDLSLSDLDARYRQLADELAHMGYMLKGSLSQRLTTCGNRGCQCRADPPRLHGPYWQWSTAVEGKTVTRLLSAEQVPLYREWIENRHRAEELLRQMHEVASQAALILLSKTSTAASAAPGHGNRPRQRRSGRQFVRGK
jgi:hypothetical protein